ncbi:RNA polymerase II transcriptional coactivator KELP [Iris pallida]|uniref:RNA polymerase II transcriptional coactivator KELP n=1 Tax=Iris pallida TaxID=29817 RepID=A0AAX6IFE8_IRIPA|nr:RNA polymerase II transcriptional coactivator KELP [Iris pallida]
MEETTEYKVRTAAAEKLGLDLSLPDRKLFVRKVVETSSCPEERRRRRRREQSTTTNRRSRRRRSGVRKKRRRKGIRRKKRVRRRRGPHHLQTVIRRVTIQDFKGRTWCRSGSTTQGRQADAFFQRYKSDS